GRDPLLGEDAHQVVFEGEIEARGTGIALAASAATELIVDTPGFVALCAYDVKAACGDHLVVLFFRSRSILCKGFLPGFLSGFKFLPLIVEADHARTRHGIDRALRCID